MKYLLLVVALVLPFASIAHADGVASQVSAYRRANELTSVQMDESTERTGPAAGAGHGGA